MVVQILGQEYQFRVDSEREDAQAVVDYLKTRVEEAKSKVKNVSDHKIIMLAALNIASDLHQLRHEFDVYRGLMGRRAKELVDVIDVEIS